MLDNDYTAGYGSSPSLLLKRRLDSVMESVAASVYGYINPPWLSSPLAILFTPVFKTLKDYRNLVHGCSVFSIKSTLLNACLWLPSPTTH
jgi:hypothetical protein